MAKSNYIENKVLDAILRHTTTGGGFPTANPYVSLHTADPGETGASEVSGGSYARQQAAFDAAVSGASTNSSNIDFAAMPVATVTHIGIWDALSGGNFLYHGALASSKTTTSGQTARIAAGELDITEA